MTTDLRKVALVTGGALRIGRVVALSLARRGWDVAVHFRQSDAAAAATVREIEAIGRCAAAVHCNLANEAETRTLLARASAALGGAPIACVVNNASLFEHDDAANFSLASLDAHMHANLGAPLILAQALHDATPDGAQAVAINLLDQKLFNLNPDFLSYTLSKAALHTATTMLAQALAPKVRVVGVAPGLTMASHLQSEHDFTMTHKMSPLGGSSNPEDVADAVVFAAENRAITGSTIVVDGGQHLVPLTRDFSLIKRF